LPRVRKDEWVNNPIDRFILAKLEANGLRPSEQADRENLRPGDRIKAVLVRVEKTPKGAQVVLSRSTPDLVRALFENEVPEIFDKTIEIKGIAREAGSRTKVAVASNDPNVDPVGACVGMKGSRVRAVVEELSGEKIDIVRWSDDPAELCRNALNPADILEIALDEESRTVLVTVPHDQLSLAIGKRGQNARLASRLIGWNIDIRSDLELKGEVPAAAPETAVEPQQGITVTPEGDEVPVEYKARSEAGSGTESTGA